MCPLTPCMTPLHHVPRTRRTEGARPLSSHDVTQIAFHYFFALPLPLPLPLPPPFLGAGGDEAVPRTPWLGQGIQPVSGPLTPCTEGKTGLRSTNPMYGRRPLTPGASPAGACSVP